MKQILLLALIALASCVLLCACRSTPPLSDNTSTVPPVSSFTSAETSTQPPETETPTPDYGAWDDDGALKILMIGNSFSDDTIEYAYQIATDLGLEQVVLGNLYIGGCNLNTHYANLRSDAHNYVYRYNNSGTWTNHENFSIKDALISDNWDFISLQQSSGVSGQTTSYSSLKNIISEIQELCAASQNTSASLVWNMTWAYQGNSTHAEFYKYQNDQLTMYEAIVSAVKEVILTSDAFAVVIPNGTSIQNARTSFLGDTLTRDGYHLSIDTGRYIAALTMLHALIGMPIDSVTYMPPSLATNIHAEIIRDICIESAKNAVASPYTVTQSHQTEAPVLDLSQYTEVLPEWIPLAYYNSSVNRNLVKNASNSHQFYATLLFTKEDLPIGSILILESGWRYRPEGWPYNGERPEMVTANAVRVTETWWGDYLYRGFNLSLTSGASLENKGDAATAAFRIYVPKS